MEKKCDIQSSSYVCLVRYQTYLLQPKHTVLKTVLSFGFKKMITNFYNGVTGEVAVKN